VKTFNAKGVEKLFTYFWFLNHSLRWFLVVPPKDRFAQGGVECSFGMNAKFEENFLMCELKGMEAILNNIF
jgi:hypothetical protein